MGDLAVGDTVAVEAARAGQGLVARRLTPLHPLVGPVDKVEGRQLSVMGTTVTLSDGAVVADGLRAGDLVEVSGIWRSGAVVATRVTRARPDAMAQVAGLLLGEDARRTIGGTAVDLGCCDDTALGFAAVRGRYDGTALVAEDVTAGTSALFAPEVRWLVVEAFLARNPADPGFHLSGFGIPMDPASPVPPTVGQRSVFVGRLDRDFLIERSYPLPEGSEARLRALDGIGADALLP
jgi:hypothetical protein